MGYIAGLWADVRAMLMSETVGRASRREDGGQEIEAAAKRRLAHRTAPPETEQAASKFLPTFQRGMAWNRALPRHTAHS